MVRDVVVERGEVIGRTLQIDVVSDVMCPWCMIGKRRLEGAIETFGGAVDVRWRPFQLDPTLPPGGRDRREYLETKFGGPERAKAIYSRIEEAGREEGIEFAFDRIAVSPNTLDAHRLIRWAGSAAKDAQSRVVDALFEAFFLRGRDIGSHDVLVDVTRDCGMDEAIVADLLATDRDVEAVREAIAQARAMGVTGVPCFIVDRRYAIMGAEPADTLVAAMNTASAAPAS